MVGNRGKKSSSKSSVRTKSKIKVKPQQTVRIYVPALVGKERLSWEQVRALLALHDAGYEQGMAVFPHASDAEDGPAAAGLRSEARRVQELRRLGLAERNPSTPREVHHYRISDAGERLFR